MDRAGRHYNLHDAVLQHAVLVSFLDCDMHGPTRGLAASICCLRLPWSPMTDKATVAYALVQQSIAWMGLSKNRWLQDRPKRV